MLFKLIDTFRTWGRAQRAMAITFPSVRELAARRRADGGATGTIVAFYTKNSFYETEKDRLVKSARHLGLDVQATAVESAISQSGRLSFQASVCPRTGVDPAKARIASASAVSNASSVGRRWPNFSA